jgi:Uma2 family endonuclease
MATLVLDPTTEERIRAERAASGGDRFDEVWDGVYTMSPLADNEHQDIQARLLSAIQAAVGWSSPSKIQAGVNVSDREDEWEHNYRCPDLVVFKPNTKAKDCGTHWLGGPDFAVEITSPYDRSREKLDFYAKVGVLELMIVDRQKWAIELYRLTGDKLVLDQSCRVDAGVRLVSNVLGLTFTLVAGQPRPLIEVASKDEGQSWLV